MKKIINEISANFSKILPLINNLTLVMPWIKSFFTILILRNIKMTVIEPKTGVKTLKKRGKCESNNMIQIIEGTIIDAVPITIQIKNLQTIDIHSIFCMNCKVNEYPIKNNKTIKRKFNIKSTAIMYFN